MENVKIPPMWSENNKKFMGKALSLAESMYGKTSPDPLVGAVIVKDNKIVGEGYHAETTTPHAENWAIQKARDKAKGATLYVNLEPCCFFEEKNNPPCTKAIIQAGIKTVVAAMEDPNPSVAGKGFRELKEAGIEVMVGLMENEAKKLNEVFIKHISTKRPYIIIKAAMSLDGKIATKTGESFWITGIESRKYGHHLRNTTDAIMVGIGTILKDDPSLTVREIENKTKNPIKIILDPLTKIKLTSKALKNDPGKTIVVVSEKAQKEKTKKIRMLGAKTLTAKTKNQFFDMDSLMKELYKLGITSILIEGGGNTHAAALAANIVDKVYFFIAPKIIGGAKALTPVEGKGIKLISEAIKLKDLEIERLGPDFLIKGYVEK